jgi:DNA repair exonuclease SbcCD ATPase subunit
MGLDFLKRKEEMGKTVYSNFSKSMLSNVYNSEKLKSDNETYEENIKDYKQQNEELSKKLIDVLERIVTGQEFRDGLLKDKHTDIDNEISQLSPIKVKSEIEKLELSKSTVVKELSELNVVEPSEFYHEDKHDEVKEQYKELNKEFIQLETKISEVQKLQSSVSGGIKCEHCGIDLMNASITQAKINELAGFITHKDQIYGVMQVLTGTELAFVRLKKEFDEYEKNKLIKEKHELSIESFDLKINGLKDKLKKYQEVQDKILKNNTIEEKLIKAGTRLTELEGEKTKINRTIDSNTYNIETLTEKIETNKQTILKIAEEFEKEKIYKIYLEVFGKNGISKLVMKTMLPLINSELQRLLEDSSHFRLEIRINEKNEVDFVMIDNNSQVEKNMASGSGYERTIASLAVRAVLSKICSLPKPNIIVFDEVFGKISNDNLDMVSEFFIKIKEYFEKIFLITHNPLVTNWSDNVVRIRKEENISYVTQ